MSKTRDTGFLGNVIKVDTSGNVSFVSGSTTLATINTSGQLSGSSPVLSSSYALNADLLDGLDSTQFTLTSSFAAQTASFTAFTSSINSFSASILSYTASQNITNGTFTTTSSFNAQTASFTAFTASVNSFTASQLVLNGTYATTGSNTFAGIQTINSNLIVTGSITAQTLVVQTITSSVDFVTGSTRFGSISENTHQFTGSMSVSGSTTFSGNVNIGTAGSEKLNIFGAGSQFINIKNTTTNADMFVGMSSALSASFIGTGGTDPIVFSTAGTEKMRITSGGLVGIGATDPVKTLDVRGTLAISNNASSYWYMDRSDDDGRFKILTDGNSEKFSISATGVAIFSGSVGIGAVTPSVLLNTFLNDDLTTIQIRAESNTSAVVSYTGLGASVLEYYRNVATGVDLTIQTKIQAAGSGGNIVFSPNSPSVNLTPVERMRITKDGNVGIGTTGPVSTNLTGSLTIVKSYSGDTPTSTTAQTYYTNQSNLYLFGRNAGLTMVGNANEECIIAFASPSSAYIGGIRYATESTATGGAMKFQTSGSTERMRITVSGSVGIGTTDPLTTLSVKGAGANGILLDQDANSVGASSRLFFKMNTQTYTMLADNSGLNFMSGATPGSSSGAVKMTLTSGGNLGINTASPTGLGGIVFAISAASTYPEIVWERTGTGARKWGALIGNDSPFLLRDYTSGNNVFRIDAGATDTALSINSSGYVRVNSFLSGFDGSSAQFQVNGFSRMGQIIMHNLSNTAQAVALSCSGADTFFVNGTFTANVKSFLIPHPLTNLKTTHNLRYVSVESPQADLIYRGKIRLAAGRAVVNIDEAATMTEGTFEALCREVQCFTSNESGWDLTKGTVEGNILTIESQNTESTNEINWLVIGERHDEYMMNTNWTDENGRVIVEPLAPEEITIT